MPARDAKGRFVRASSAPSVPELPPDASPAAPEASPTAPEASPATPEITGLADLFDELAESAESFELSEPSPLQEVLPVLARVRPGLGRMSAIRRARAAA